MILRPALGLLVEGKAGTLDRDGCNLRCADPGIATQLIRITLQRLSHRGQKRHEVHVAAESELLPDMTAMVLDGARGAPQELPYLLGREGEY